MKRIHISFFFLAVEETSFFFFRGGGDFISFCPSEEEPFFFSVSGKISFNCRDGEYFTFFFVGLLET